MSREFDVEDLDYEIEKKKHPIRTLFFSIILICILTIIYARYIGTSGLLVKEYNIKSKNITNTYNGLKIAHFSDIHYGRTIRLNELKNIVSDINKTKPDIIVFTGDFIDRDVRIKDEEILNITEELKKLDSTYGNYYVNGNHDKKFDKYDEMMKNANFFSLNNNYDVIYNTNNESILISGLSIKPDTKYLETVSTTKTILFSYSSHPCVTLRCYAVLSCFSPVHLFATLRTVAHQALQSMGFSRQEHWSGLPCPPPGGLPDPGIEPSSLAPPALVPYH